MSIRTVKLTFSESIKDYDLTYDAINLFASHQLFDKVIVNNHHTQSIPSIDLNPIVELFSNVSTDWESVDNSIPVIYITSSSTVGIVFTNLNTKTEYQYSERFNLLVDLLSDRINISNLTIIKTSSRYTIGFTFDRLISHLDKQIKTNVIEVKSYQPSNVIDTIISKNLKDRDSNHILVLLSDDTSKLLQVNSNNHSYYIHCIDGIVTTSTLMKILTLIVDKT